MYASNLYCKITLVCLDSSLSVACTYSVGRKISRSNRTYTQERFCNITVVFIDGCLVAQHTVAEIWSIQIKSNQFFFFIYDLIRGNFTVIFPII